MTPTGRLAAIAQTITEELTTTQASIGDALSAILNSLSAIENTRITDLAQAADIRRAAEDEYSATVEKIQQEYRRKVNEQYTILQGVISDLGA